MRKQIICVSATNNCGKSSSIKKLSSLLESKRIKYEPVGEQGYDIVKVFTFENGKKVGLSSCGDPNYNGDGIDALVKEGCDVIVCASRTKGVSVNDVNGSASKSDYNVIWIYPIHDYGDTDYMDDNFRPVFYEANAEVLLKLIERIIG